MKRVCITALALSVNVNAFAGVCPGSGSNTISATSLINTNLNPSATASEFVMINYNYNSTGDPVTDPVVDGPFGVNLGQGIGDDVWSTGALESKLKDQKDPKKAPGVRAKTLRYFGGERTIVHNVDGDFIFTTGDYTKKTEEMEDITYLANDVDVDPKYTDFVEFLTHAKEIGANSIHFVVNVQEAFARCIPNGTAVDAPCASYYNSNQALRNKDNFDPEDKSVHYNTIAAAVQSYSVKAANWAGWVKERLAKPEFAGYNPTVYWDIGNEVNLSTTHYSLTAEQYNMVLHNYSYRIRKQDPNYRVGESYVPTYLIGAVGPSSGAKAWDINGWNEWWSALHPAYFDFIDIHDNYGMAAFNNPAISESEATCSTTEGFPGKAKERIDGTPICRKTNWPTVDTGKSLDQLAKNINDDIKKRYPGSTYTAKKIAITEWNAPTLGNTWWLDNMADVSDRQAMLNNAAMIGDFYSSPSLLNAVLWPAYDEESKEDYRTIIKHTPPHQATLVQQGFLLLSPALSGIFQKYQGPGSSEVVKWQTQAGPNRYVVIVNSRNDNVSVPITVTLDDNIVFVKGISQAEEAPTNCNFETVPHVQKTYNIVVGAKSLTRLSMWH